MKITPKECKELAERLGIAWPDPLNEKQQFYVNGYCVAKEEMQFPDFLDARVVLREAMKKDWFNAFVRESLGGLYYPIDNGFLEPNCILIRTGLVLDETGQLAKMLLEWLRKEKI